jgi:O-acetyl-ADP-ribose deacetylase
MNAPPPEPASASVPSSGNIETIIAEATTKLGGVVDIRRADILAFPGDAIVVPTTTDGDGGVKINEAIRAAAGPESWSVIRNEFGYGLKKIGGARKTNSHNIAACKYIIHAIGPDRRSSNEMGETAGRLLKKCISRSLALAEAAGADSIAMSPISTGIYGFAPGEAARLTLETVKTFLELDSRPKPIEELSFVFGEDNDVDEVEYHNLFP